MSFGGFILTNNGRNEIAKAETGEIFNITAICFGDGLYNGSFIQKSELTNTVMILPVTKVAREDDRVIVECDFNSKEAPKAFYLREVGIIANDKLCYYDNAQDDAEYIDPDSEVYVKQRRMRFILLISSEVNVTVKISSKLYALKSELDEHKSDNIVHITDNERNTWNNKVDKVSGKGLSANDYTNEDREKLSGVEEAANKYEHPVAHPATMITEDELHRFVKDTEKSNWNSSFQKAKDYADNTYQQATGYTDTKIAELINGAPSTLDTLKEIADAMAENDKVVDALDSAIGTKANDVDFNAHKNNSTIHITGDERTTWNNALQNAQKYADGKFLPLEGGTIVNDKFDSFKIMRNSAGFAALGFKNTNGVLGYIGMHTPGMLCRIAADGTSVLLLDTNNYKDYAAPKTHNHSSILDSNNNSKTITFAYSKKGLDTANWLAAWDGYELRAISPANMLKSIGAAPEEHTHDNHMILFEVENSIRLKIPISVEANSSGYFSESSSEIIRNRTIKAENANCVLFLRKQLSISNDCFNIHDHTTTSYINYGIKATINGIPNTYYAYVTLTNNISTSNMLVEFSSNSGISVEEIL